MNSSHPIEKHSYKNQIRDIQRCIKRCSGDEEKLSQLKQRLHELEIASFITTHREELLKTRKQNKKLRFNEQKKLQRLMKNEETIKEKTKNAYTVESMLNYTTYFPDCENYIPLFPQKPLSEEQLQKQKTIMEFTDSAKADLDTFQQTALDNDQKYRKSVLNKMVKMLKEMRERAEVAVLHSESDEETANPKNENEHSGEQLDDDFFIEE